ncbi:MAG: hypothetical protein QXL17_00230 [Candidatus Thermoplasmatota archaeon]
MPYHIASDDIVVDAVVHVLRQYRTIPSQRVLKHLVEAHLQTEHQVYHVSEVRLRKLVLKHGIATVEIQSREGDPEKVLTKCPVCETMLKRVKNQTIYGGEVTIEYHCDLCGYWTGKKKRVPTRYIFHGK